MHKDPLDYHIFTYLWVIALSCMGGIVSFFRKVNMGVVHRFSLVEFIGELFTSGFTGLLTFLMCEESGIPLRYTAVMVAISGHMGTRLIFLFEQWVQKKLPLPEDEV